MKNIHLKLMGVLLLTLIACEEEGKSPFDNITDNLGTAGGLRTINLESPSIDLNDIANSQFSVEVEQWDNEDGRLLESVDLFVQFQDLTPNNGDSSVDEVMVRNIPGSEFSVNGSSGLPRATITVGAQEAIDLLGVNPATDIDGGDVFRFRLALKLTDGSVFSSNNLEGNITGAFFNSPFTYPISVVCSGDETFMVGAYTLTAVDSPVGGVPIFSETSVTITAVSDIRREIMVTYLGDLGIGNGPVPFQFDLVCTTVNIPENQSSGLQCSSGIVFGPADPVDALNFDNMDDSTITIQFTEDVNEDCGSAVLSSITLTKV